MLGNGAFRHTESLNIPGNYLLNFLPYSLEPDPAEKCGDISKTE